MSHTSNIESSSAPDGLQEIRSWASRSPNSARPGFRARRRPGRPSSALAASVALTAVFLLSLGGYRVIQSGRGTSDPATVPEPEQVAQVVQESDEAPPASAAVHAVEEPVPVRAAPPARSAPGERSRKEATVVQRRPAPKEPTAASRVVVSRDAFESEPAVLLSAPAAEYPDVARGTGTTAEIIVGFTIDETGAVRDPAVESSRVQGSAPEALFVEEALAAAQRARFHPARERGIPTRSWNTLTFSFETGPPPAGS